MGRLLSPGNVAVLLLLLTIWIPSKILPEGTSISLALIDDRSGNSEKLPELDRSEVEIPDYTTQSLRHILDKWGGEIGFWDSPSRVSVVIYNNEIVSCTDVYGNPVYRWAEYDDMDISRLKYDEDANTLYLKIKGDKSMEKYGVKNPKDDPAYFENHIRQILARAFMHYPYPIISKEGTAPYSWLHTGAVVASALYNDCDIEIEYEMPVLKGKTPEWKGKILYEGKNDLLEACDYSFYELSENDKYLHSGDDWTISMFITH